jgi:hypothetical protein
MKKNLMFIAVLFALISCNQSPQEKANALIEIDLKKSLFHPESYDPAETIIDSAFTPFDDPYFYEKAVNLCKLGVEMEEYEHKIKYEKSDMALYKDLLKIMYSNRDKEKYDQAKENYEKYLAAKNNTEQKIVQLVEELKKDLEKESQFIGFKAKHRYRAQTNGGQIVFGEVKYLFDKEITKIVSAYDMDGDEYKAVQVLYKEMLGEE